MQKEDKITLPQKTFIYRGYSRTSVFNLTQQKHWFLPNQWGEILCNPNGIRIAELPKKLSPSTEIEIQNDLLFLLRNKIININSNLIKTKTSDQQKISYNLKTTCSISMSKQLSTAFLAAIKPLKFDKLELYLFGKINILRSIQALTNLKVQSIDLHLNYSQLKRLNLDQLIASMPKITTISILNTPFQYMENYNNVRIKKYKTYANYELNANQLKKPGNSEFHRYYNRRIHLSSDGSIYNSPYSIKKFGNIFKQSICEVYASEAFQWIWKAKKDLTDVCCDCEFRGICIDRRPLIKRNNGTWYANESCAYNPYLSAFKTDSAYRTLEECGIRSTPQGFKFLVDQFIEIKNSQPDSEIAIESNIRSFFY